MNPDDDKTLIGNTDNSQPSGLAPGSSFGQFRIVRVLGRGGMGEVYEVEHIDLGKRFALKLIHPEIISNTDALNRFRREAKVMAQLDHPNLLKVDDFGQTSGRYWIRMELIRGVDQNSEGKSDSSLRDYLIQRGGKLPEAEVKAIVEQILEGLSYAHSKGVIHRDLKPANILLSSPSAIRHSPSTSTSNLTLKISDFGLVRMVGEAWLKSQVEKSVARSMSMGDDLTRIDDSASGGTSTKALLGTYAYMSPEQKRGEEVDHRSDLYAVGLMAFQMLTGVQQQGFDMPSDLVDGLNPDWDIWVKRALSTKPINRFASADEMIGQVPQSIVSDSGDVVSDEVSEVSSTSVLPENPEVAQSNNDTPFVANNKTSETTPEFPREESKKNSNQTEPSPGSARLPLVIIAMCIFLGLLIYYSFQPKDIPEFGKVTATTPGDHIAPELQESASAAESAKDALGPIRGQDYSMDLGGGVTMEFVWIGDLNAWVGKYEVTNAEFRRFRSVHNSGDNFNGPRQPVVNVNYNDAMNFTQWLSGREGLQEGWTQARLLTGDEWSAIARCGMHREYPWGNSMPPTRGNYSNSIKSYSSGAGITVNVDQSGRNEWGLYGVGGNVWEWTNEERGSWRVLRGASWNVSYPGNLSIEHRDTPHPSDRYNYFGFRVVLAISENSQSETKDTASRINAANHVAYSLFQALEMRENVTVSLSSDEKIELIWLAPGEFVMGSPSMESGRHINEGPQTRVRFNQGYWLGKYPVTVGEFRAFAEASGYRTEAERNPSTGIRIYDGNDWTHGPNKSWRNVFADNDRNPVVGVSWNDAIEFCNWLTERESAAGRLPDGYVYTLPSEEQWEYAARGGTTTRWSFGDEGSHLEDYGWFSENSGGQTRPVGQKLANPWGLYDIHGNVFEWTRSWKGSYPSESLTDFEGPNMGSSRVFRGGAWIYSAGYSRSAYRYGISPSNRNYILGFRLALAPTPQTH